MYTNLNVPFLPVMIQNDLVSAMSSDISFRYQDINNFLILT